MSAAPMLQLDQWHGFKLLLSLMTFLFLIPAQIAVNKHNAQIMPSHDPNATFSGANWLWIILGSIFLLLGIIGSLLPQEGI